MELNWLLVDKMKESYNEDWDIDLRENLCAFLPQGGEDAVWRQRKEQNTLMSNNEIYEEERWGEQG